MLSANSQGFLKVAPDLIVYAIIAAGLVFWLRNLLGTRHGEERERPNPYLRPVENNAEAIKDPNAIEGEVIQKNTIADLADNPTQELSIKTEEAQAGLQAIANADKGFEVKDFVGKAQDAFIYIVGAYADGDRETLKDLLGENVYNAFEGGIKAREERGETQKTEILSFKNTEILEASLKDKMASVTLRFVAEQNNIVHDDQGNTISGSETKPMEMIDIWVFTRKVSSGDPRWFVSETRSDDPNDNDILPNTD